MPATMLSTSNTSHTDVEPAKLLDVQIPNWIRISPCGKQVVYSTALFMKHRTGDNALSTIWIAEMGKDKSARQLTSGLFCDEQPQWAPDGESIAFVSDRAKAGKSNAIYQLSLRGGEAVPLTPVDNEREIAQFLWSPDGKCIAYLSPDEKTAEQKVREEAKDDAQVYGEDWVFNRLRLLHVSSKSISVLVRRDAHLGEIAWKSDGSAVAFTVQQTPEIESAFDGSSLEYVSLVDKKTTTVTESCTFMYSGGMQVSWLDDKIYFVGGQKKDSENTSMVLYSVNVKSGAWSIEAGGVTDCISNLIRAGDKILIHALCGLDDEIRDSEGSAISGVMTGLQEWHAVKTPSGEIVLAVAKSSASAPIEVFSYSSGGNLDKLSQHGGDVSPGHCVVTTLQVKSSDGKVTLDGLFVAPENCSKPCPTIVLPHGGPYSRTGNRFMPAYGWVRTMKTLADT